VSKNVPDRIQRALRAHQAAKDPLAALDAARTLREEAELLERRSVDNVRAAGTSWSKIGALYGLTKQGAQQRFRRDATPTGSTEPGNDGRDERRDEGQRALH
jgi:hypothetical protein